MKILCTMRDSACKWRAFEVLIYHMYIFIYLSASKKYRILTGLSKYVFMNHPIVFLFFNRISMVFNKDNKNKVVPAPFSKLLGK